MVMKMLIYKKKKKIWWRHTSVLYTAKYSVLAWHIKWQNVFICCNLQSGCNKFEGRTIICDPAWANEALWGRYQNWHFKFNILFNIKGIFWHQNNFHIIFLTKVTDNLISNYLITLKINCQDMGRQSYWFVHKPIEDIKNNWIKT